MNMKKIKLVGAAVALSCMTFIAGCSSSASKSASGTSGNSDSNKSVTVVLKTLSSPYWQYVQAGAEAAGKKLGVKVNVVGPSAESQVMEQVNMIQDQISQSPSALVVSPSQPTTVVPVLTSAVKAKIPVLLIDSDAAFDGKTTFIGTDNATAGAQAGKLLSSMLQKGDKVVLIAGALGNPATDQRIKGAKDALTKEGIKIVAQQPGDSDKSKAMTVMENILQKNSDIKGVFAANDDMALGALRAVQAKHLDIKVIGTDGTEEAVQSILSGGLAGTIAQSPYNMGYQGVENALKASDGKKISSRIDSGIQVITKDNAQKQLDFLKSISK
ncbi:monosaccharide ABC transporter substrate-binding protein (CUT2 family) [Neobacillus bataviensis]|uniref:Monosaccharide ABC transporter substrate-binding protein (CUT2 family) n=1 Tax=Neobacillus bataviensis TaxID=220685 RepID=A0A561D338_9BACI|nr:substrate-binding domain-containing protein [Neobacillus bataviensis]TWD97508.1 monosaccharide ABC transporter substrate-binding protein (CUT2 family) [Neobacillus bataviensis]